CVADPWCDARFPNFLPAVLRVQLRDGEEREVRIASSKGTNARPLTEQELTAKFVLAASSAIGMTRALALRDAVRELADDAPLDALAALTSGVRPHAEQPGGHAS
ncbi:MmgE/PrpD family protein, partial [Burkholderia pseudomallei]|nr:MmgE/PrpD family protein [Burkholderia pseudomallei]